MQPEAPAQKPRRERHLVRWIFIGILAILGWQSWKAYDFNQALKEAKELGWNFAYNDPFAKIRENWKAAFRKETWRVTERQLFVEQNRQLEPHFDLVRRLNPTQIRSENIFYGPDLSEFKGLAGLTILELWSCPNLENIDALKGMKGLEQLVIINSPFLSNIDALKELKNLHSLRLAGCTALTHLDALRDLTALKSLYLSNCRGLKSVDGLLGLTGLKELGLVGCRGITKEAVDAAAEALPKTSIDSPDGYGFFRPKNTTPRP